ncbi:MAG TPA: GNAT family N-acetyltransferase [Phycisphaerales bacterium]|nr:GNAT family N-acetyltransferase [Phycisphaerales bacterium]
MLDARSICRSIAEMHSLLCSLRAEPPLQVRFPGATAFMRPGEDSASPSSSANRLMVYDPANVDPVETARLALPAFAAAGIRHWFLEMGAGITAEQARRVTREFGARPRTRVRYPVLARVPAGVPPVETTLEIRRPNVEEVLKHAAEIDAIWSTPGAAASMVNAMARPANFTPVLGLADGRAVAMGMLVVGDTPGGLAYLSAGGTHPDFRNRGGQSAIIAERVRIAHKLGRDVCTSETVLADSASTANLIRAGFAVVFEWQILEFGHLSTS